MGLTFKQLQDKCILYGYNEYDRNRIKEFLNDAQQDIFSRYVWTWAEGLTSLSLAQGSSTVAMPSAATTSYQAGRIQKVTSPAIGIQVPEYVDYLTTGASWVDDIVEEVGYPTEYTIYAGVIYFNRLAPQAMIFQFTYWNQPNRMVLDNDESLIPDHFREVMVYGALKRMADQQRDTVLSRTMREEYEGGILQMRKADRRGVGTELTAALPLSYYGGRR